MNYRLKGGNAREDSEKEKSSMIGQIPEWPNGQTVNLLAYAFGGSNPSFAHNSYSPCCYSSAVEHFLGKEEVPGFKSR